MKLYKEIKAMRLFAGMTQQQLAEKTGMCQSVIVRLENSENPHEPRICILNRIATACGRDIEINFPVK